MTLDGTIFGESKNVEFKALRPEKSIKYMKTVVAFANGKGGRIIFGIDDKTREVIGIPKDVIFQEIDAITNAISDSCEPTIIPDVYLQTMDGKAVIVADIAAGRQKPYYVKSEGFEQGVYLRVSGTTRPADRDMIRELYYECEGRSYDSVIRTDIQITEDDVAQLCEQMKAVARAHCKSDLQRDSVKDITKNILISWGILKYGEDGILYPTNAYIYLTGQDSFRSVIQCAVFKGNNRAVFLDRREYTGPLWEQMEQALTFVLRNIRLGATFEGLYRQDMYELPPDSIRELLVNAILNCSYIQNGRIQVALYDNRLEITSPGGLQPGVTIDLMKEGFSKIRNRALANAFLYMNLIEGWGSGVPRIMRESMLYGLKTPEFIDMDVAFRIHLYRKESEFGAGESRVKESQSEHNYLNDGIMKIQNGIDDLRNGINNSQGGVNWRYNGVNSDCVGVNYYDYEGGHDRKRCSKNIELSSDGNQSQFYDERITSELASQLLKLIGENGRRTQGEYASILGVSKRTISRVFADLQKENLLVQKGTRRLPYWIIL